MGYLVYKVSSQKWNINKNMNIYGYLFLFFIVKLYKYISTGSHMETSSSLLIPTFILSSVSLLYMNILCFNILYVNCMAIISIFIRQFNISHHWLWEKSTQLHGITFNVLKLIPGLMIRITDDSHAYKQRRWGLLIWIQRVLEDIKLILNSISF